LSLSTQMSHEQKKLLHKKILSIQDRSSSLWVKNRSGSISQHGRNEWAVAQPVKIGGTAGNTFLPLRALRSPAKV
jgi:hypothetical protein